MVLRYLVHYTHILSTVLTAHNNEDKDECCRNLPVSILLTPVFVHKKKFLFSNSPKVFLRYLSEISLYSQLIPYTWPDNQPNGNVLLQRSGNDPHSSSDPRLLKAIWWLWQLVNYLLKIFIEHQLAAKCGWLKHNDSSFKVLGAASNLSFGTLRKHIHLHEFSARWKSTLG